MARFDDDEMLGKAYDSQLMRRLATFIVPYKGRLAVAIVLLLGASLAELVGPLLIQRAIDGPIRAGNVAGVWPYFVIYMTALVAAFALRYGQIWFMQQIGQQIMVDMRSLIFSHIQRMSLAFFDRNPVGRLITRLTSDVDALNEFFTQGVVALVGNFTTLIGVIVLMFVLNWRLALLSILVMPIVAVTTWFFQRLMRSAYRLVRQRIARINANLNEQLTGVLVVQLFNGERRSEGRFDDLNRDYLAANLQSLRAFSLFFPTVGFLSALGTALLLYWGGNGVLAGWATLGMLVAFTQYLEQAFRPIRDLAEKYSILQSAMASSERIFGILDTPTDVKDPTQPITLPEHVRGEVEFRNVVFGYDPNEPVLRDVSFTIPAGQAVAIVGATGAGKSSTISLLARFYDIQQGEILLDGINIAHVAQHDLRRHVAAVPQDPVCFSGTIASNIRLHAEDISDERIRQAAKVANAAPFVERLPGQYDYEVRERGSNLSVGQRQLLAFARAMAFNPEVLLVLDEATSSVDTETEALIQTGLEQLMHGRTSVVIAHRLSTIRHVDRIIVLHKGKVVEDGTHDDLLALKGYYHRLYHLQYLETQANKA